MSLLVKIRVAAVVLLITMATRTASAQPSLQLQNGVFKVEGWTPPTAEPAQGWVSIFAIYTGTGDAPALLGSYRVEGGTLVFRPQFPFAPGVSYRAVFRPGGGAKPMEQTFAGPPRATVPVARVESVYPSGDTLPSNQLRLYFYFSAPMSREEAAKRIHLLDESRKPLNDVFLPGEELWDPGFRRLTLTFDPGRIKRGLTSNQKMGPPIVEGRQYTLVVDREWPDARGVPMVEGFRKTFRGGPAQRTPPRPSDWHVNSPKAGSSEPLTVDFPGPMNYPLLLRMLHVAGAHGMVAGTVSVAQHEAKWRFTPAEPWKAGKYQLIVDTALEDLAGNHIGQAFDVDVFDHVTEHIDAKTVSLDFEVH
jgi:hypothetical protein